MVLSLSEKTQKMPRKERIDKEANKADGRIITLETSLKLPGVEWVISFWSFFFLYWEKTSRKLLGKFWESGKWIYNWLRFNWSDSQKKEKEKRRRFKWARTWSIRPNKKKRNFATISKKWTQWKELGAHNIP